MAMQTKLPKSSLNLEEIFCQFSNVASDTRPSPSLSPLESTTVLTINDDRSGGVISNKGNGNGFCNKICLTPLSNQACLAQGINPDALRRRTFESFRDANEKVDDCNNDDDTAEILQRLRFDAYEKRRHDFFKVASEERTIILKKREEKLSKENKEYNKQNSEKKDKVKKEEQKDEIMKEQGNKVGAEREESIEGIAPDQKEGHDAKYLTSFMLDLTSIIEPKAEFRKNSVNVNDAMLSTPSVTQNSVKISTQTNHLSTIEVVEKRRLTKQRERRKKELKQMLLFEQQREKIKHDRQQQFEKDQIAEKKKRDNKKKQEMRAADERRIRELRLKRREEVEEELARVHSRVQFEKDKKIRANMESKKASERKSLKKVEEEKKNRNNFKQIQIERKTMLAYLESQQRINEREEKELRQQEKAKLKKMRDHEVLERKRIDKAQKIALHKAASRRKEEERIKILVEKQDMIEMQRERIHSNIEHERKARIQVRDEITSKREYQVQKSRIREEMTKEELLEKFDRKGRHLLEVENRKKKQRFFSKAKKAIRIEMKMENVNRMKRMLEYKRLETMRKVEESNKRMEDLALKHKKIERERRKVTMEANIQKDKLLEILVKSKTSSGRVIKKMMTALAEEDNCNAKNEGGMELNEGEMLSIDKSENNASRLKDTNSRCSSSLLIKDGNLEQRKDLQFNQKLPSTIKCLPPFNIPSLSSLRLDKHSESVVELNESPYAASIS